MVEEQINNKNINCTIISRWQKGDLATGSSDLESVILYAKKIIGHLKY